MFLFGTNLKMNQTPQHTREFVRAVRERSSTVPSHKHAALWIIPPFTSIEAAAAEARGSAITIGAQNMHWADDGAFTGEISPVMLKAAGADFVMLGHAERRTLFGETDETLNKKVLAAAKHQLNIMLCVGEPAHVFRVKAGDEYVATQLKVCLAGLADLRGVQVLYEPVWSIGTGGTAADPTYVTRAFDNIRRVLIELSGNAGRHVPILYGGSVDASNCASYARLDQASGMGVGRAGWNIDSFFNVFGAALAAWIDHRNSGKTS